MPGEPEIELDHFVIGVSDCGRSNAFYRSVLGAELVSDLCFAWRGSVTS